MTTYYKPSQWRGKRQIYRSTDPEEPKRETATLLTFLVASVVGFVVILVLIALSR